jgi:hypothetical protein
MYIQEVVYKGFGKGGFLFVLVYSYMLGNMVHAC